MTDAADLDWGIETTAPASQPLSSDNSSPAPDEPSLSEPVRCLNCGEWHSICRPQAATILRETIARETSERLLNCESVLRLMHEGDRVAVARWIIGVISRPPFSTGRSRTIEPIHKLLDALWWDINNMTPDPISPTVEGGWTVPLPHHELVEMREDAGL
jgi:hypothetical protein